MRFWGLGSVGCESKLLWLRIMRFLKIDLLQVVVVSGGETAGGDETSVIVASDGESAGRDGEEVRARVKEILWRSRNIDGNSPLRLWLLGFIEKW